MASSHRIHNLGTAEVFLKQPACFCPKCASGNQSVHPWAQALISVPCSCFLRCHAARSYCRISLRNEKASPPTPWLLREFGQLSNYADYRSCMPLYNPVSPTAFRQGNLIAMGVTPPSPFQIPALGAKSNLCPRPYEGRAGLAQCHIREFSE